MRRKVPEGQEEARAAEAAAESTTALASAIHARDDRIRQGVLEDLLSGLADLGLAQPRMPRDFASLDAAAGAGGPQVAGDAVPAFSAARVVPCSDIRYRALTPEQGSIVRTPEGDREIKEYMLALQEKDNTTLQRLHAKAVDDYKRANEMVIGAMDADSGLGADLTGGRLVPLPLSNLLISVLQRTATMRQVGQLFTTSAATLRVVLQSGHGTAAWSGENDALTNTRANYSSKMLIKKKLTWLTVVSNELLADSAFNIVNLVAADAGQTMAAEEDLQLCVSDGTGNLPTEGLDTFATTLTGTHEIAPGTAATIDKKLLVDMFFGVHKPYRTGAVWLAGDDVLALLTQLYDAQGRPILNLMTEPLAPVSDQFPGAIGKIMNRPIIEIPCAAGKLYFGDWKRGFMVLDGGGIVASASADAGFENDVTKFRFIRRVDGRGGSGGATGKRTFTYAEALTAVA
jgi:HK97 family phage major capsid protein